MFCTYQTLNIVVVMHDFVKIPYYRFLTFLIKKSKNQGIFLHLINTPWFFSWKIPKISQLIYYPALFNHKNTPDMRYRYSGNHPASAPDDRYRTAPDPHFLEFPSSGNSKAPDAAPESSSDSPH